MTTLVDRLANVYKQELALYHEVLGIVERERTALQQCRPLSEIIESFKRKRDLLRAIELMNESIVVDKTEFGKRKPLLDVKETSEVAKMIHAIKDIIERIMALEQGNEEIIMSHESPGASSAGLGE